MTTLQKQAIRQMQLLFSDLGMQIHYLKEPDVREMVKTSETEVLSKISFIREEIQGWMTALLNEE